MLLEAFPKLVRDKVLQLGLKQVAKDSLELIEDGLLLLLFDLDAEELVGDRGNCVQLLDHRVHVASRPGVLQNKNATIL